MPQITSQARQIFPPCGRFQWGFLSSGAAFSVGLICWLAWLSGRDEPAARLVHPLACLGHALFVYAVVSLFSEWRCLNSCRSTRADGWGGDYTGDTIDRWAAVLDARCMFYLALALGPAVLGMTASLLALPSPDRERFPAAHYFLPWAIGCVETLFPVCAVFLLRSSWRRMLEAWRQELPSVSGASRTELERWEKELNDLKEQLVNREKELVDLRQQLAGKAPLPENVVNPLSSNDRVCEPVPRPNTPETTEPVERP